MIDRRAIRIFLCISLIGLTAHRVRAAEPPMNVLVIQTDEHNFRTLGCYRDLMDFEQAYIWGPKVKVDTPHIDWIAQEGAICDSYYATSPVCTPSRASLVSGLYPQNTGAISNNISLHDDVVTFGKILSDHGYATGYAGKWHLDGPAKPGWAPKRAFGFSDNRYMFNRGHWKKLDIGPSGPEVAARDKKGNPSYAVDGADESTFTTDFLANRAIDFITEHHEQPFCFMVAIPDPHGPNTVRAPYDTMYDKLPFRPPISASAQGYSLPSFASVSNGGFQPRQMANYFGMVKCIDDNVGRIIATLREHDVLDHTLILFTSDHGDMCGELGRHNKGIPCEGSARVPFVIRAPGVIPPGRVIHQALGTVDFTPTLMGLLGIESGRTFEGRDASVLFKDNEPPKDWNDIAFVRIGQSPGGWFGAFTSDYKLVFSNSDDPAFYDLTADPNELKNLRDDPEHRERIRNMARQLLAYAETYHEPHLAEERVREDLDWAISDAKSYQSPRSQNTPRQKRKKSVK